jgi:hypothetical protein
VFTASPTKVTVGVPHASVAVTDATLGAGTAWLQVSVGGAGQVMVGGGYIHGSYNCLRTDSRYYRKDLLHDKFL